MKTIWEMVDKYNTKRNAKKYWRSFEWQDYRDKLAKRLKDWKKGWKSKEELAEILWKEQWTVEYAEMMVNCWRTLDVELAKKLINSWNKKFVLENIENFKNHNEIAKILIDSWNWIRVRNNLHKFNISDENIRKELEKRHKEQEEKLEKLKEIWEKFLEFGIEYTIDKKSLLLNIKWDIKGNTFYDCYELGLFQYVGKIDGNLSIENPRGHIDFTFENLKCINWDLIIGNCNRWYIECEAENLCLVNWNLELRGRLNAPLKEVSWDYCCYGPAEYVPPSKKLEYVGGRIKLHSGRGRTHDFHYFPVLRYAGWISCIDYVVATNTSTKIGDKGIYDGPIYFIDPDDPMLNQKVYVVRSGINRLGASDEERDLYYSIPKSTDKSFHIKHTRPYLSEPDD